MTQNFDSKAWDLDTQENDNALIKESSPIVIIHQDVLCMLQSRTGGALKQHEPDRGVPPDETRPLITREAPMAKRVLLQ